MYDFEETIDRRKTDSVKWDIKKNELPMWVADMDFQVAPEIVSAIKNKADQAVFGYEWPREDYFNAVAGWYETEHHARPNTDWMLFVTGVVPAISSMVRRLSNVGDNVLVQAPVYNIFYNSIVNNGRHVLSNDLVFDGEGYSIDFDDLEKKMSEPTTTLMILCNPHNPVGKIWSRDDLIRLAELANEHGVKIISDEIHGDITFTEDGYVPMFSLPENLIQNVAVCVSTSKTFNVAAIHAATIIVPNEHLRDTVNRGINTDEISEPNSFAIPATIAAYTKGHKWLGELKEKLTSNRELVADYLKENIPEIKLIHSDATYLLWLDVQEISDDSAKLQEFIRNDTGLYLSAGNVYGGDGNDFLRMNIACPTSSVKDGLDRLAKSIKDF
ncbi:MalY/PatB family protein [Companilactobacillus ginsenosidimutans]|uniref:cysteine-S-conjugate beta-lyase n=1 Tax=Companilactobacillus ginsenosidimutans TaxID=1007676 RepID=A0A0H4QHB1_9LACO|nr:MalY/PatB family protein [Companilactobacillus ginsenosidimutans]AKP67804.1 plastocyanin [Companilactobacillus ginsenosidimutans]